MGRTLLLVVLGLSLAACPADDVPVDASSGSTTGEPATTQASGSGQADSAPTSSAASNTDSDTASPEPWLEVGWGVAEFNAFDGTLPVVVGPQGLAMFSLPLRGAGFYVPPNPSFDDPDMPILQAWVDVDGYEDSPGGHLNEVVDYPALFYPSLDPGVLEGPAVWLVIPDGVEPSELVGLAAHLHVEMVDRDGLMLTDDHDLVIGDVPPPPKGP